MVSEILTLLALAATSAVEPASQGSGGARVEVLVSATIQRGVTVRADRPPSEIALLPASKRPSRSCDAADKTAPGCYLIVYDLP